MVQKQNPALYVSQPVCIVIHRQRVFLIGQFFCALTHFHLFQSLGLLRDQWDFSRHASDIFVRHWGHFSTIKTFFGVILTVGFL